MGKNIKKIWKTFLKEMLGEIKKKQKIEKIKRKRKKKEKIDFERI